MLLDRALAEMGTGYVDVAEQLLRELLKRSDVSEHGLAGAHNNLGLPGSTPLGTT